MENLNYDIFNYVILVLFVSLMFFIAIGSSFDINVFDPIFKLIDFASFFLSRIENFKIKKDVRITNFREIKILFFKPKYYIWIKKKEEIYKIKIDSKEEYEYYSDFALTKKKVTREVFPLMKKGKFETSYRFMSKPKFL